MTGGDIIKQYKTRWIILVDNDTRILCNSNGTPLITTDTPEAKNLAMLHCGRCVDLAEWLHKKGD